MKLRNYLIIYTALLALGSIRASVQAQPPVVAGIVQGVVTDDSSGNPIKGAFVAFLSTRPTWFPWRINFTITDSLGHYSTKLDTARYFVVAVKFGYFPEWYNNVRTRDSATALSVSSGDTVKADFRLHGIPPPVLVSGTVTDSVSGLPLPGALVAFFRPFHWPPGSEIPAGLIPGFPSDLERPEPVGIPTIGWIARTDSTGRYTARVAAGATLISASFKFGYVPEFYDDKHSPFEANKLVFSRDTSGIDFDLVPIPTFTGSLSGTVVDSARRGVPSHVLLIDMRADPRTLITRHIFYRATDSLGNYQFDHLPDAPYAVRAIPVTQYAPAWYDADSCGVLEWSAADSVHVAGNVTGIDICVKSLSATGVGVIAGTVFQAPHTSSSAGGPGISGTVVYALTPGNNQVLGFDVTDVDGSYRIQNLPAGVYDVAADKEGYLPASPRQYTLDAADNYTVTQASIGISPAIPLGVGPGKGGIPREFSLNQNYPNPFNPMTTISYDIGQASVVTLKVYDILGREVATLVNEVKSPGSYRTSWDASNFPTGVYTYRVQAGKFVDMKKMSLIR
ncbi:MAG TPA: carboxypeptidase regulatory-like domain-containing protein [Bacteroidota bacterium]|nr:carboxypeptidase regulatory-like domain-containing protein [Bacteroidota bacterium]